MQDNGLINKLYRPIEKSQITPDTHQSTPSRSKTPPASENHRITINRSLPATPLTQSNTTPRILSLENSSLNAKLESLESKLCGKIMAMKSHFMDELRSLKQESPVKIKRDNKIEEVTTLRNQTKLLEIENQLLKDDVSNKQKFISTILEFNFKLSNNIDINVNREQVVNRKQPPIKESQNDDSNVKDATDIEQHDFNQNKKTTNEHSDKEKTEKKKQNKDNPSSSKNVYSMVKNVEGWKLKKSLRQNQNVFVRSFSGAKIKCMKDYVKPCIRENNPEYIILHVGTNELKSDSTPERIAKSVVDVGKNIQSDNRTVAISSIVPRNDNFNNKAMEVNKELCKMCEREKLFFVDNSNINPKTHLNGSKVHINRNGDVKLGKNFVNFIRNNFS